VAREPHGAEADPFSRRSSSPLASLSLALRSRSRSPQLFKGKDYLHQTRLVIEALGAPSAETIARTVDHPAAAAFISSLPSEPRHAPAARMPEGTDPHALDLLTRLLAFDAAQRPTAADSLDHEFFAALRGLNDNPVAPPFDFAFEEEGVTEERLRALVWEEMRAFHPTLGPPPHAPGVR
jgi:serine/threonine protein kinase